MSITPKDCEGIKLQKTHRVKVLMDLRHILDEDVRKVIYRAETTGEKLYQPKTDKYLAKMRIGRATFYVEYSVEGGVYPVHTAYSHESEIK